MIDFCENPKSWAPPADPEKIANYVADLTKSSLKSSSIRIAVVSISSIHKLSSFDDPTQHSAVKIQMWRMHRTLGRQSKQAYGITAPILGKMLSITSNNLEGINNAIEINGDLKGTQINRIYKRLAKEVGLPKELIDHISGHSMRVSATQDLLRVGASIPMIINSGR